VACSLRNSAGEHIRSSYSHREQPGGTNDLPGRQEE
jgi:hypothetical protein